MRSPLELMITRCPARLYRIQSLPRRATTAWACQIAPQAVHCQCLAPLRHGWLQVQNLHNPSGLAGLSVASLLLAVSGNGLMAPRALLLRDPVWLAGSAWGCFMGWAQLLTLLLGGYLALALFAAATVLLAAFVTVVLWRDSQSSHPAA